MSDHRPLPMFPLGTVLMPGRVLPLFLFEQRYLQLYHDVITGDRQFGVVLIERGREAGSPQNREFEIGCVARIVGSAVHDDGRISIVTVGTRRLRVLQWLEPDPYPRAIVREVDSNQVTPSGVEAVDEAKARLSTLLALFSELGADVGSTTPELSDDPVVASYQIAQLSGLQTLDLQKILETNDADARAELVADSVAEQVELVRLQLSMG